MGKQMTNAELTALIASDSVALTHFVASRDQLCAERCSAIAPTIRVPVPAADIQYDASVNGVWAKITIARESSATPDQIKGICITFLDWVKSGRPIDFDMPEVVAMLAGLVTAGLVTAQQAIDMDARATVAQVITSNQISDCRS
jgi:hypothetical protein